MPYYYSVLTHGPSNGATGKAYRTPATAHKAAQRATRTASTVRIGRHATAEEARQADISDNNLELIPF